MPDLEFPYLPGETLRVPGENGLPAPEPAWRFKDDAAPPLWVMATLRALATGNDAEGDAPESWAVEIAADWDTCSVLNDLSRRVCGVWHDADGAFRKQRTRGAKTLKASKADWLNACWRAHAGLVLADLKERGERPADAYSRLEFEWPLLVKARQAFKDSRQAIHDDASARERRAFETAANWPLGSVVYFIAWQDIRAAWDGRGHPVRGGDISWQTLADWAALAWGEEGGRPAEHPDPAGALMLALRCGDIVAKARAPSGGALQTVLRDEWENDALLISGDELGAAVGVSRDGAIVWRDLVFDRATVMRTAHGRAEAPAPLPLLVGAAAAVSPEQSSGLGFKPWGDETQADLVELNQWGLSRAAKCMEARKGKLSSISHRKIADVFIGARRVAPDGYRAWQDANRTPAGSPKPRCDFEDDVRAAAPRSPARRTIQAVLPGSEWGATETPYNGGKKRSSTSAV